MTMEGDVMKMRELPSGLEIPAGGTVELKPGGFHLMFMGVKTPFKEGDTLKVELKFEKAGQVDVDLPVTAAQGDMHGG
jgi:periplasmic copper chaperone A